MNEKIELIITVIAVIVFVSGCFVLPILWIEREPVILVIMGLITLISAGIVAIQIDA